jgi:hypothetical protein
MPQEAQAAGKGREGMREPSDEFKAMLNANKWHDRSEIDRFIEVIKKLSEAPKWTEAGDYAPGSNRWSWARNHVCKYVDLRFDMRDGGFVLLASGGHSDKQRISLEQLEWQHGEDRP